MKEDGCVGQRRYVDEAGVEAVDVMLDVVVDVIMVVPVIDIGIVNELLPLAVVAVVTSLRS